MNEDLEALEELKLKANDDGTLRRSNIIEEELKKNTVEKITYSALNANSIDVPLATEITIECDMLKINSNGISLSLDLPSLENVAAIIINGIKFVKQF